MVIFNMASMTKNNQIGKIVIFSIMINMVCIQSFLAFANSTMIRKLSQCKSSIAKFTINKIWVFISNLFMRSLPRFIVTIFRTVNIFNFAVSSQVFFIAQFAIFKPVRIPSKVRTFNRTELPFFCAMMQKLFATYLTDCFRVMIKVVAFSTAVKSVQSFISGNKKGLFTKFTGFFHGISLPKGRFLCNYQPLYQGD